VENSLGLSEAQKVLGVFQCTSGPPHGPRFEWEFSGSPALLDSGSFLLHDRARGGLDALPFSYLSGDVEGLDDYCPHSLDLGDMALLAVPTRAMGNLM
jgi:hypothetical protein